MPKSPPPRAPVVCLLRHGEAGEHLAIPTRDHVRPLTEKGRKQARRAGRVLARLGLEPAEVWTSPLRRARETAEVAAKGAGARRDLLETATLVPDAAPERVTRALRDAARGHGKGRRSGHGASAPTRWLVGHEPHLSRLLGHWTGSPASAFRFGKGAIAVVEFPDAEVRAGDGRLVVLLSADAAKDLG